MSKRISIGRAPGNTVRIDERWDMVSNEHADIERNGDEFMLYDHSTNGTTVDGQSIHKTSIRIYPGQRIVLGKQFDLDWNTIKFYLPDEQSAQPAGNFGQRTVNFTPDGRQEGDQRTVSFSSGGQQDADRNAEMFGQRPVAADDFRTKGQEYSYYNYGKANEYSQAEIDDAIRKWNWGAFFCTWLWGLFNRTYWPLLFILISFIPYLGQASGIFLCVYMGLNGSKIAWESGKYKDFGAFKRAQRHWAIGGSIVFIVDVALTCLILHAVLSQI